MDDVEVQVFVEPGGRAPVQATPGAAGFDLYAALAESMTIEPGERMQIPTGLRLAIPAGFEGQVRPRSGLALKHGVTVLNPPGTIDSDFRGEIRVMLVNLGGDEATIQPGDRIAQLVVAPVPRVRLVAVGSVEELGQTVRGDGGFGSTGMGAVEAVPLGVPDAGSMDGQVGLFAALDGRGPMEV